MIQKALYWFQPSSREKTYVRGFEQVILYGYQKQPNMLAKGLKFLKYKLSRFSHAAVQLGKHDDPEKEINIFLSSGHRSVGLSDIVLI